MNLSIEVPKPCNILKKRLTIIGGYSESSFKIFYDSSH